MRFSLLGAVRTPLRVVLSPPCFLDRWHVGRQGRTAHPHTVAGSPPWTPASGIGWPETAHYFEDAAWGIGERHADEGRRRRAVVIVWLILRDRLADLDRRGVVRWNSNAC